jgi:hypothetical protein
LPSIVRDPRVALLFLIPGVGNTLRVNGRAKLCIDPELLATFAVDGHTPRSVVVIDVDAVYFQCARALVRSELWNPAKYVDPLALPSAGQMLASINPMSAAKPTIGLGRSTPRPRSGSGGAFSPERRRDRLDAKEHRQRF